MNQIEALYFSLLKDWCDALISLQLTQVQYKELKGGMVCPACGRIHGRTADAILPMMYMAKRTGDVKYLNSARGLFAWSDNMFREGHYYVNDYENDWTGITVFFCVQLGEALQSFFRLLEEEELIKWREHYYDTADYVREKIDKIGGTINYPITGAYAMALAWKLSGQDKYLKKAQELAGIGCEHLSPDGLLFGEAHPCDAMTAKGARGIDIGYNMEESLPALLEYSHLVKDEKAEHLVLSALETHLKFFLPDGGMDNSFGSRCYKWTYWGSRTSDGIQAVATLFGNKYPKFQQIAYENALLLQRCTHDGLLYGGPMFHEVGEAACIHHTFCHAKVMAKALMILEQGNDEEGIIEGYDCSRADRRIRTFERRLEYFPDLCTYLIQSGKWRVTLTDYDYEYCPASHATGGAMTLLWHAEAGPVCAASMNRYYIVEPNNMQFLRTKEDICMTPRIEFTDNGKCFRSIQDLTAVVTALERENEFIIDARGRMTDEEQNGEETYRIQYAITGSEIRFLVECSKESEFILPVIADKKESVCYLSKNEIELRKQSVTLKIRATGEFTELDADRRIFNPVGGFLAYPVTMKTTPKQPLLVTIA